MRIVITGGTGQLGRIIARHFYERGDELTVLSRHALTAPWPTVVWNGRDIDLWAGELEGAHALINLAGRSVNCRYNPKNRFEILQSRFETTRVLGQALALCAHPPKVWLNMSTATIYRHSLDREMNEASGELGGGEAGLPRSWGFSVEVAKLWEKTLFDSPPSSTRKLALRSAMVMSPEGGGVFEVLLRLVRLGFGGMAGPGTQFVSWIHEADFLRSVDFLIANESLEGPINICSPNPIPNREFMDELRWAWGALVGLAAEPWMLETGAWLLRTETELILKSRRAIPGRLLESGFDFEYPDWREAAEDLVMRWRRIQHARQRAW